MYFYTGYLAHIVGHFTDHSARWQAGQRAMIFQYAQSLGVHNTYQSNPYPANVENMVSS